MLLEQERPFLILLPKARDAVRFLRELEFFLPKGFVSGNQSEKRLFDFPAYDISPLTGLSVSSLLRGGCFFLLPDRQNEILLSGGRGIGSGQVNGLIVL